MRLIVVSNRLPVTIAQNNQEYFLRQSVGGLATGLKAFLKSMRKSEFPYVWVGWPGLHINLNIDTKVMSELKNKCYHPITLSQKVMDKFYGGFCNSTLWPLFHDCPEYISNQNHDWVNYKKVNEIFCQKLTQILRPTDIVWIHDYHFLLLPQLLRQSCPNNHIGFFLHIPFPSLTAMEHLVNQHRVELLQGMLGADLIGFHTQKYCQNFFKAVTKYLKYKSSYSIIKAPRRCKVWAYPMGIDYNYFQKQAKSADKISETLHRLKRRKGSKIILSIDRLDYTKGILNRIDAYEKFLAENKEWRKKVTLLSIVAPSRDTISAYSLLKKQIDEVVGKINGKYGDLDWLPVIYIYRSFTTDQVIKLYANCDVAMVTPLRDGMNLVAKEYVAAKYNQRGILILSEKAGAAKELTEALIVNPNCKEEITAAIKRSLEMSLSEQKECMKAMQTKVKNNNVVQWGNNFIDDLLVTKKVKDMITHA